MENHEINEQNTARDEHDKTTETLVDTSIEIIKDILEVDDTTPSKEVDIAEVPTDAIPLDKSQETDAETAPITCATGDETTLDSTETPEERGEEIAKAEFNLHDFLKLDNRFVDSTGKPIQKQLNGEMEIREIGLHDIHIPPRTKTHDLDIADLEEKIHLWGLIEPIHVIPYRPAVFAEKQMADKETTSEQEAAITVAESIDAEELEASLEELQDTVKSVEDTSLEISLNLADYPDDDKGVKYILLSGYRRYMATLSLGKAYIPAIVDTTRPIEIVRYLEMLVNNVKVYGFEELMAFGKYVEERQKGFSYETIEGILGLPSGQYLKMKYIDGNRDIFADIYDKVVAGKMTVDAAFKKLEKEANSGNVDGNGAPVENGKMDSIDAGMSDLVADGQDPHVQKKGERHPLAPALRKEVERRDFYTCQACGLGRDNTLYSAIFHAHHMIPVKHGGPDDADNLIMLCPNCHSLVHSIDEKRVKFKQKMIEASPVLSNILNLAVIVNKGLPEDAGDLQPYPFYMSLATQTWITEEARRRMVEAIELERQRELQKENNTQTGLDEMSGDFIENETPS